MEAPTALPSSRACSEEAHRRLRLDGILGQDCTAPGDLSAVADAVFLATNSQASLVARMPRQEFRAATPNDGHVLAAALLREHAIGAVLTLNFDLAFSTALANVGCRGDVTIVNGPEDHSQLTPFSLVYLHRTANDDPEKWILRTAALATAWKDHWEEVVARRLLSSPVIVFAGLGTPAGVLVETVSRIRASVPANGVEVFQADVVPQSASAFAAALSLSAGAYVQLGWIAFMRILALRVVADFRHEIEQASDKLVQQESWTAQDVVGVFNRLSLGDLLKLGRARAAWTLARGRYLPAHEVVTEWMADLLLAVALLENTLSAVARLRDDGTIELQRAGIPPVTFGIAHGRGAKTWGALEAELGTLTSQSEVTHRPARVLVSGVSGGRPTAVSPPQNIVGALSPDSIVGSIGLPELIGADELRAAPASVAAKMVAE